MLREVWRADVMRGLLGEAREGRVGVEGSEDSQHMTTLRYSTTVDLLDGRTDVDVVALVEVDAPDRSVGYAGGATVVCVLAGTEDVTRLVSARGLERIVEDACGAAAEREADARAEAAEARYEAWKEIE